MHTLQPGLYLWLAGLVLLIVVVTYGVPWWKARRERGTRPRIPPGTDADLDDLDEPRRPSA